MTATRGRMAAAEAREKTEARRGNSFSSERTRAAAGAWKEGGAEEEGGGEDAGG